MRKGEPVYDVTFENVQAGARTALLFRLANFHNAIVMGTGDLSELALGWCTYGVGDQMSHYNVNASVPKTLIQHLIRWVAEREEFGADVSATLRAVLATEISPELVPGDGDKPGQRTEDMIGPYPLQDFNLFYITRYGLRPSKVAYLAWNAWRDAKAGAWPAGCSEARTSAPTISPPFENGCGCSCSVSSRSASSSAPPCRTGRRSAPAARCRRAATGARRAIPMPTPGSPNSKRTCRRRLRSLLARQRRREARVAWRQHPL